MTASDITYGSIISDGNLTHEYNATLGLGHIYGTITTNAAISAYGGNNLFQITTYAPSLCAWTIYNANNIRGHNVIFNGTQCKYVDSLAITGAVIFCMDVLYKYTT